MCVVCAVDEATKNKIIARSAALHRVSTSPFGKDDEVGMLNLVDAASRQAIMSRADPTKVFDLSVDHFVGMPGWTKAGDQTYQIWMTHTPEGELADNGMGRGTAQNTLIAYSGDSISMYTHCGTHIDTFNHFGYNGEIFNHFSARRIWAAVLGASAEPRSIRRSSPAAFSSMSRPCTVSTACRPATASTKRSSPLA